MSSPGFCVGLSITGAQRTDASPGTESLGPGMKMPTAVWFLLLQSECLVLLFESPVSFYLSIVLVFTPVWKFS